MTVKVHCKHDKMVRLSDIKPNPRNPNHHSKSQIELIAHIIKHHGWRVPITVSNRSGFVVRGHGRLLAARHLGIDTAPVDYQDYESAAMEMADLVADNRIAELADMDKLGLREILGELPKDFDMKLAGFDLDDFNVLMGTTATVGEDDVPEPIGKAITKTGDLWLLGDHRLLCGDSAKSDDVNKLIDDKEIHMVNTDPPYNVKVEPRSNNAIAAGLSSFKQTHHQSLDLARHPNKGRNPTNKKMRAKDRPLDNDFLSDERFNELLAAWFGNIARVLNPGHGFYIWGGVCQSRQLPACSEEVRPVFLAGDCMGQRTPSIDTEGLYGCV